jgi:hypothetical protein
MRLKKDQAEALIRKLNGQETARREITAALGGRHLSPDSPELAARRKAAARIARTHAQRMFEAQCEARGLPVPTPEYQFALEEGREWAFDWLFDGWLALEVEGGVFGKGAACPVCKRRPAGAHSSVEGIKRDIEKYNRAAMLGYVVIRCLPEDITSGAAFALVEEALATIGEQP